MNKDSTIPDWNQAPEEAVYFLPADENWFASWHRESSEGGEYQIPGQNEWQPIHSARLKNRVAITRQPNPNFNYAPADATHFGWENEEYNAGWYKLDDAGIWYFLSIDAKPGTKWYELDKNTDEGYKRYEKTFVPRSHVFAPKPEETKSKIRISDGLKSAVLKQLTPENDVDNW